MAEAIYEYGKELLKKDNTLVLKRRTGMLPDYDTFKIEHLKNIVSECNLFNFDDLTYSIHSKEYIKNDFMKWHIDDALLLNRKNLNNFKNIIDINCKNKHMVYKYETLIPLYSLLIYENDYGKDFNGGELEFADGFTYKPTRGSYIMFDSSEVHRVLPIKSGTRFSKLIKFYN